MTTLRAPDGREYRTENEHEVKNLTLGHGYAVVRDETEQPKPATPRARRTPQPATPEHADTTDA
ncbi:MULTISPECIES: hypothetical protein [Amycolatopsis]|uniref:Uncharacterized protein n=2 Tax=Amycolatopsis TaxID=1813 RepID=A0A229S593_9PSEU|nr:MULTISPECIES: hypothetical protein [Amycolatopsis]AXB41301.1 hypothetical protein A4R43_01190 [Amycolatopsis albispora]OXM53774.1 hypothetical protein CFP71_21420 [Amycolatopsis thailandensis]